MRRVNWKEVKLTNGELSSKFKRISLFFILILSLAIFIYQNRHYRFEIITLQELQDEYMAEPNNFTFNWTLSDFDKLQVGENGKGDSINSIVEIYGKASYLTKDSENSLTLYYSSFDSRETVTLSFIKYQNNFYLDTASFSQFLNLEDLGIHFKLDGEVLNQNDLSQFSKIQENDTGKVLEDLILSCKMPTDYHHTMVKSEDDAFETLDLFFETDKSEEVVDLQFERNIGDRSFKLKKVFPMDK